MPQSNVEVIQAFYAAIAIGDGPAALANVDAAVVWTEAENFPYADRSPYVGHAAVVEGVFARLGSEWENFQVAPAEYLDAGDTIVAIGRYKGVYKATGKRVDAPFVHVWRLRGGKVVAFQQYTDTVAVAGVVKG